jgi:SAM-dependent methyltransferase
VPELEPLALEIIARYGDAMPDPVERRAEARRFAEQAAWVRNANTVVDIGGGYSPFAPLLAELGVATTVLDTFDEEYFTKRLDHRRVVEDTGVRLVRWDAVAGEPLPFDEHSIDAITTFDSLEHWHHSPRRLLHDARRVLVPGGRIVIGTPNAVNLRKRLAVPLGRSNWSRFEDWYDPPVFTGHVREPTVSDLGRIARDVGLASWQIVGRNWLGFRRRRLGQAIATVVDRPLRLRPSLCSTLYLVGDFPR